MHRAGSRSASSLIGPAAQPGGGTPHDRYRLRRSVGFPCLQGPQRLTTLDEHDHLIDASSSKERARAVADVVCDLHNADPVWKARQRAGAIAAIFSGLTVAAVGGVPPLPGSPESVPWRWLRYALPCLPTSGGGQNRPSSSSSSASDAAGAAVGSSGRSANWRWISRSRAIV